MQCWRHPHKISTGRCRRCGKLFCETCLEAGPRRPVCWDCQGKPDDRRRGGVPLAVLLLLPAIVGPIGIVAYDEFSGAQRKRNEEEAIRALRDLASVQAQFREGDRENDNLLDYATTLAELGKAGLIDNDLADGEYRGYKFGLSGSTFDWLATATPISERTGVRNFMICTDGVVRLSRSGPALCSHVCFQ